MKIIIKRPTGPLDKTEKYFAVAILFVKTQPMVDFQNRHHQHCVPPDMKMRRYNLILFFRISIILVASELKISIAESEIHYFLLRDDQSSVPSNLILYSAIILKNLPIFLEFEGKQF